MTSTMNNRVPSYTSVADEAQRQDESGRPLKMSRSEFTPGDATLRPPTLCGVPSHDVLDSSREAALTSGGRIFEYTKAANPEVSPVPAPMAMGGPSDGPTRIVEFDLRSHLNTPYSATSPNLLVSFARLRAGESLATPAVAATSQAFYVIAGKGASTCDEHGVIPWAAGDMVVLPKCQGEVKHTADAAHDSQLYWVHDGPLLAYLGVSPDRSTFAPTVIRREAMLKEVTAISHEPGAKHKNRMGILLGNAVTDYVSTEAAAAGAAGRTGAGGAHFPEKDQASKVEVEENKADEALAAAASAGRAYDGSGTLTLTPVLWSLLNVLPAHDVQRPHRHQSVALDLCVYAPEGGAVYTLMGPELDEATGTVKNGIKSPWVTGAVFVTPPGWWHSHHNESGEAAWVLPMQDAGLLTYQRALDIRFAEAPAAPAAPAAETAASSSSLSTN